MVIIMTEDKPYRYVRFCWSQEYKLEKLAEELEANFTLVKPPEKEVTNMMGRNLGVIEVKADTLFAFLSSDKAILFQKEKAPFTKRDMELRKAVFDLYLHNRTTPLSFPMGNIEPKFEVESEERKKA